MGTVYLVRHAKAGNRSEWDGDDSMRPLTGKGRRQAIKIGERLAATAAGTLLSSPYVRCVQTLEPLAELLGTTVVVDERLVEGTGFAGALALLETVPDGSVLCSHGDVIPDTIAALQRRGCNVVGEPEWRKGSVWQLQRGVDGTISEATSWPPPDRD